MKVAVVIPLFNGARWIRTTLTQVFRQTRPAAEVVVVDDGSTDGSPEIVREFPEALLLHNPEKGANPARRFGSASTTAPYVAFLDQDDFWHPEHLRLLAGWLDQRPACRAVASTECVVNRQHPRPQWDFSDRTVTKNDAWRSFPFGPAIGAPSAVLMRRSCLDEIGGWPVAFPGLADYFTWLGLSADGTPRGGMGLLRTCTMARNRRQFSYSAHLRTGPAVVTYSQNLLRASREAAGRFGSRCSLPPAGLRLRLQLAVDLDRLVSSASAGNWEEFAAAARDAWEAIPANAGFLRRKFGGMTSWFLDGRRTLPEALEVYDRAIAHWPKEDVATRAVFAARQNHYRRMAAGG